MLKQIYEFEEFVAVSFNGITNWETYELELNRLKSQIKNSMQIILCKIDLITERIKALKIEGRKEKIEYFKLKIKKLQYDLKYINHKNNISHVKFIECNPVKLCKAYCGNTINSGTKYRLCHGCYIKKKSKNESS